MSTTTLAAFRRCNKVSNDTRLKSLIEKNLSLDTIFEILMDEDTDSLYEMILRNYQDITVEIVAISSRSNWYKAVSEFETTEAKDFGMLVNVRIGANVFHGKEYYGTITKSGSIWIEESFGESYERF